MKRPLRSLSLIVLSAMLAVSGYVCMPKESDESGLPCVPGFSEPCYTGSALTAGVGICRMGQSFCWEEDGVIMGPICRNQTTPQPETCNGLDDNCDGQPDNQGACSQEMIQTLEEEIGLLSVITKPELASPLLISNARWGTMYACDENVQGMDCVEHFMDRFADKGYGLATKIGGVTYSWRDVLDLDGRSTSGVDGDAKRVSYQQRFLLELPYGTESLVSKQCGQSSACWIPVQDGSFSVSYRDNRLFDVHAEILSVPQSLSASLQVNSLLPAKVARTKIPTLDDKAEGTLVVYTLRDEQGYLPVLEQQEHVLAWRFDDGDRSVFVHAQEGTLLSYTAKALAFVPSAASSRKDGIEKAEKKEAWKDLLEFSDLPANLGKTVWKGDDLPAEFQELGDNACDQVVVREGCDPEYSTDCRPDEEKVKKGCGFGLIAGCSSSEGVAFCDDASLSLEDVIQEMSLHLYLKNTGSIELKSVAHSDVAFAFAYAYSEMFECWKALEESGDSLTADSLCPWTVRNSQDRAGQTESPSENGMTPYSENMTDSPRNGRMMAHAFYELWRYYVEDLTWRFYNEKHDETRVYQLHDVEGLALRKLQVLMQHATLARGMNRILERIDLTSSMWTACNTLKNIQSLGTVASYLPFTNSDCTAVLASFKSVGLWNATFPGVVELCNNEDDNQNGLDDECGSNAVEGLTCNEEDALSDYTLRRRHYTGDPKKLGVGECTKGVQICRNGEWYWETPQHSGTDETCNYKDDDCDGQTDEVGDVEFALRKPFVLDADHDCYGKQDGQTVLLCTEDLEGSRAANVLAPQAVVSPQYGDGCFAPPLDARTPLYIPYPTEETRFDCNDSNPAIHPNATETCNYKDDNCNGLEDEDEEGTDLGQRVAYILDADQDCYGVAAGDPKPLCVMENGSVLTQGWPLPAGSAASDFDVEQAQCTNKGEQVIFYFVPQGWKKDCNDVVPSINPGAVEVPCNSYDDNCNNDIDELDSDFCGTNAQGEDIQIGQLCKTDHHGICEEGICTCTDEVPFCKENIAPGTIRETCDGRDEDCDGISDSDDEFLGLDEYCETGEEGVCSTGKYTSCEEREGAWQKICTYDTIDGHSPRTTEICNGLDDDCDGRTDEGSSICEGNEKCISGSCTQVGDTLNLDDGEQMVLLFENPSLTGYEVGRTKQQCNTACCPVNECPNGGSANQCHGVQNDAATSMVFYLNQGDCVLLRNNKCGETGEIQCAVCGLGLPIIIQEVGVSFAPGISNYSDTPCLSDNCSGPHHGPIFDFDHMTNSGEWCCSDGWLGAHNDYITSVQFISRSDALIQCGF